MLEFSEALPALPFSFLGRLIATVRHISSEIGLSGKRERRAVGHTIASGKAQSPQ